MPVFQRHPWEHRRPDQIGLSRTIRTRTVSEAAGRAGNRQDAAAEIAGKLNAIEGQIMSIERKVAIITGASQGLGAELVRGLPQSQLSRRRQLAVDRAEL